MMTTAQIIKTSITVTNNSPSTLSPSCTLVNVYHCYFALDILNPRSFGGRQDVRITGTTLH